MGQYLRKSIVSLKRCVLAGLSLLIIIRFNIR